MTFQLGTMPQNPSPAWTLTIEFVDSDVVAPPATVPVLREHIAPASPTALVADILRDTGLAVAWRSLADDAAAADRFKEVSEAYSVLSDETKRKQYDQMRRNPFGQYQGGRRTQSPGQSGDPNGSFFSFDTGTGFEDLFGGAGGGVTDFFGRMFGGEQEPGTSTRTRRRPVRRGP